MTSKKVHVSSGTPVTGFVMVMAMVMLSIMLGGCGAFDRKTKVVAPYELQTPYPAEKLWAVAPIRNESGTSLIDSASLADTFAAQLQRVDGINIVPVNRVLEAMAATDIQAINSVSDVMTLMQTLDVDGLLVGTVSAWNPYDPPKIGMTVQLHSRRAPGSGHSALDSRQLTRAATDHHLPGTTRYNQPINQASGYFDAANGDVLLRMKAYAHGRTPYESAAGWRRYLMNMDLYAEFVSYELTRQLITHEWRRVTDNAQAQLPPQQP